MKKILSTAVAVMGVIFTLGAQKTEFGGELISLPNMKHTDALLYSQTENSFMSARVAALGGAFTSLGADLSSMSINPAGLGMYRTSAFSISGDLGVARSYNDFNPAGKSKSAFTFNQIGTALNLYQSSGTLVSFTFGFAYNKLADLNYNQSYGWRDGDVSIGEFFAEQMYGFPSSVLSANADPCPFRNENIYIDEWAGALAYQTALIDPVKDEAGLETGAYEVTGVPLDAKVAGSMKANSRGSVGEYTFSSGLNISNILYLGATLGIQDISQTVRYSYTEQYTQPHRDDAYLEYMNFTPVSGNYGSGVNFKIGAIVRPISSLRLGVAYHSGTITSLTKEYYAAMETQFMGGVPNYYTSETLTHLYTYSYTTPSKLLLGASYTLGNRVLLSVDYDVVWNRSMELHSKDRLNEDNFKQNVEDDFGTSNNIRVGIEVVPVQGIYLRGGYAYYGSPFNEAAEQYADEGGLFYGAYKRSTTNFSLGAGFRFVSGSVLDLAWTSSTARYTDSALYYYYTDDVAAGSEPIEVVSPLTTGNKLRRSVFTMTYSYLF